MKVGVVGAGTWGQALARLVEGAGNDVLLGVVGRKPRRKIPNTKDLSSVGAFAELVLMATAPTELEDTLGALELGPQHRVVVCNRGLQEHHGVWSTDLVLRCTPVLRAGILAGPAHSSEVLAGKPCAVVVASEHDEVCRLTQAALHGPRCRVYTSNDPRGVELAGAMTRVLAVAVSLADRMHLGPGVRGLVVSRGLAEAVRLAEAMGVGTEAFFGLAGIGDIVATIGDPEHPAMMAALQADAEPHVAARAALAAGKRLGVDMPLTEAVVAVAAGRVDAAQAMEWLMSREVKAGER